MKEYGGLTYSPNSDKPYTGKVYSFYENGKRYSEGTFKDGDLISAKCWDEDGNEKDCPDYMWDD
jgi:antitoxin component YwqK of YwqJK toxin-antitoxin module